MGKLTRPRVTEVCGCYRETADAGDGECDGACVRGGVKDQGRLTERRLGLDASKVPPDAQ